MIKRILTLFALIATSAYLTLAVTVFNAKPLEQPCKGMELEIMDDVDYKFITQHNIEATLKNKNLLPIGKRQKNIDIGKLETELVKNPFVKDVECYMTKGEKIKTDIYQRIPIIRIISRNGDNYYIDNEGKAMNATNEAIHVAVATGYIDREFARDKLFRLACFLESDKFWDAQIEQINVTPKQEIELVPRVGNHILFIGEPERLETKFRKLKAFYKDGLNKIGWNKYQRISVEFNNQIICTNRQ